jgi:ADP-heptose:LPS heptosyltransferase
MLPSLFIKQFDVVLDLQNNRASRFLRLLLFPSAWSEFDKSSHLSAGERTRLCIDDIGLWQTSIETSIGLRNNILAKKLLELHQLTPSQFIIINPAGAFESRNWPIENYIDFCLKWLNKFPEIKFLILGIGSIQLKAIRLREALGDSLLNLCGNTTQTEAFALIKMAKLMLTEDGGLMHMAWTQGVPTLALFGSSPSYWSAPQGSWSICLHSSDLPCGNCLLEVCKFQDNRCLTRYSAEMVFENSVRLLSSIR